ncbi:MAG: response regulator [Deltaproteobacteria bacterium]|nr:response regulator [Deltaproteobacteria bacterium]MBW2302950.1 response regulator [Deltaproteobacteria bacterium]
MSRAPDILVVDDEPRMCESLAYLLNTREYRVSTAHCGRDAIDLLSRGEFDLALLDIHLPDMMGHEIMDHINAHCPETVVIVITGNANLDSAVAALRRGAYDYLRKPFEFDELLRTVENALNQKRLKREKDSIHKRLNISEERYRYLVQNSPDIIYTLDPRGNFTFVSDAVERLLGFKSDQLVGKHYSTIVYEEDLDKAKWFFNERRTGPRASSGIELRLKVAESEDSRDCEIRHLTVELKSTGIYDRPPKEEGKRYLGTHGVIRDISERKRLQAQLQHAERMKALGTLSGGIAHDFNNLLMGIQGNISLMLMDTDAEHPHYVRLRNIEEYVKSGADLTRQLLGFARGGKYQVKAANLNELIRKSSEMFGRTRKEIRIHRELQEDLWPVEIDEGQIEQVLLNLYVNAWHAMPQGGDLYLETRNQRITEDEALTHMLEKGPYVRVSVRDTGVGMDEATQKRIFEPFFTTKEMGRGSGLGLASAYGIIQNHDGIIGVQSEKGKGSEFYIFLPASKKAVMEEEEPEKRVLNGTETVLLVDDEEMILEVGQAMLEKLGYRVITARSGMEAVEILKGADSSGDMAVGSRGASGSSRGGVSPDLVILDMIMPGMGGGETFDRLKAINPDIKVLLSSGYSVDGQASKILERGCNGFIQKPFNINELSEKMREILKEDNPLPRARRGEETMGFHMN